MHEIVNKLTNITALLKIGDKPIGTAFVVGANIVITAKHNIEDDSSVISIELNGCTYDTTLLKKIDFVDIAILNVEELANDIEFMNICIAKPGVGERWMSRGYPSSKLDGENLLNQDNQIQQVHSQIKNEKFDIELDLDKKFNSYSGLSGAPLVVKDMIIGVIVSELTEGSKTKELKAISFSYIEEVLTNLGITIQEEFVSGTETQSSDVSAMESYSKINRTDFRTIQDKIKSVCKDIHEYRLVKYCRDVTSGINETKRYNPQHIQAMKYRIFESCQDVLIDFVIAKGDNQSLAEDEIENLIVEFTDAAENIINTRSQDYCYPLRNRDTLRKIVLDLIDTCYLSFDNKGIYTDE